MNNCPYCGFDNAPTVFKCLKCSAVMPATKLNQNISVVQQKNPPARHPGNSLPHIPTATETFMKFCIWSGVALGVVSLFAVMFFVLNKVQPLPTTGSAQTSTISHTRTIKGSGRILIANSESDFDQMMKAANSNDDAALMRMGVGGKVFGVQAGVKVRIVDSGLFKSKVSILEGNQAGRSGWLPNEWIKE